MSSNPNALMIIDPQKSIEDAKNRRSIVVTMRERSILKEGVDFGVVPGSTKPTLLKPGAERLCAAFGFNPQFEVLDKVERWDEERPLFFYQIVCHLIHIDSGAEVATGVGSCNSMESKYRWRWVPEGEVPADLDKSRLLSRQGAISEFNFAIEKAETSGQYGKPAAYWQAFKDAINNRTARSITRKTSKGNELPAWEIGGLTYRIPNDDVFSLVNTVVKMACKRALVAAALIGANASEFFTQDVEDMPGFGIAEDVVIDAAFTVIEPSKSTNEPSAGVRGAGIQQSAQQHVEAAPNWSDDEQKFTAFYKSAVEKFSFTSATVDEILARFEGLSIADWRASRGWALAALIAEFNENSLERIDNYTASMTGVDEKAAYELCQKARQIANAVLNAEFEQI